MLRFSCLFVRFCGHSRIVLSPSGESTADGGGTGSAPPQCERQSTIKNGFRSYLQWDQALSENASASLVSMMILVEDYYSGDDVWSTEALLKHPFPKYDKIVMPSVNCALLLPRILGREDAHRNTTPANLAMLLIMCDEELAIPGLIETSQSEAQPLRDNSLAVLGTILSRRVPEYGSWKPYFEHVSWDPEAALSEVERAVESGDAERVSRPVVRDAALMWGDIERVPKLLREATGQDFGYDAGRWQAWAMEHLDELADNPQEAAAYRAAYAAGQGEWYRFLGDQLKAFSTAENSLGTLDHLRYSKTAKLTRSKCVVPLAYWMSIEIHLAALNWCQSPNAAGIERNGHESTVYRDTRNHYFMFLPPAGWKAQESPDTRTKVAFNHPDAAGVLIRFIVREAAGETSDSMIDADKQTAAQMAARGISCEVQMIEFQGLKCSEVLAQLPNDAGTTMLRKFIASGLHFNIQYSAPNKTLFDKYFEEAMRSLHSIAVTGLSSGDPKKAEEQQIANRVRLAKLAAEVVSIEESRQILNEALKEFPDSSLIREALEELHDAEQRTR